jgi:hypothetical protein
MQRKQLGFNYVCPTCGYETGWNSNLKVHISQNTHPLYWESVANDAFRSSPLPTELHCPQNDCKKLFVGESA